MYGLGEKFLGVSKEMYIGKGVDENSMSMFSNSFSLHFTN
jgi:hypothetical protein